MIKRLLRKKYIIPTVLFSVVLIITTFIMYFRGEYKYIEDGTIIYTYSKLSRVSLHVGEEINYNIKVIYRNDINMEFQTISFDETEDKSRVLSSNATIKNKGDYKEQNIDYMLSFYDTGKFLISGFSLVYTLNDKKEMIYGEDIEVTVTSISDGDTMPYLQRALKIKTPIYIYLLILLVLALLATGIFFIIKRIKKKSVVVKENKLDEDKEALILLDGLYSKNYMSLSMQTHFYFELTEIFKNYLSGRFSTDIVKMTTSEFILHLDKNSIEEYESIISFLEFSDYVKFAKRSVSKINMEEHFYFCKDYIIKYKNKKCL